MTRPTSDTAEHQATYTVVLDTDPGSGTTVTVTPSSSATGTATVSPSSLSFTGGSSGTWDTPQTVTVTAVNDALDNAGDARTATVTNTVSGYTGVTTAGSVAVTVNDDDTPSWSVSVSPATIAENGGASTVTVSTGGVTFAADRTIALTLGGTATETTDYTIDSKSLTLTAGAELGDRDGDRQGRHRGRRRRDGDGDGEARQRHPGLGTDDHHHRR